MNKLISILVLFYLVSASFAQSTDSGEWIRIESDNKEVSFAIPKSYSYLFDKSGFRLSSPSNWLETVDYTNLRSITAFQKGVTMFFESYDSKSSKRGLPYFLSNYSQGGYQSLKFDEFDGLMITDDKQAFTSLYYFASDKRTYLFGIGARDKNNPVIKDFLSSIKLNGKKAFNAMGVNLVEPTQTVSFAELVETPIEIGYDIEKTKNEIKKPAEKNPIAVATPNPNGLIVLFKPRAEYTENARRGAEQGTLMLRMVLKANGHIGKITVVKKLENGLTENAIRVASRIRFLPAEKDSVPFTVVKTIQYTFKLY